MTKGVKVFWGVVIVAIIIIVVAFSRTPSEDSTGTPETGPIKIGVVVPLTGDGASFGIPIRRAGDLAIEEINTAGGIGGRKLEVVFEDGKCDGKEATSAAQKLLNVD